MADSTKCSTWVDMFNLFAADSHDSAALAASPAKDGRAELLYDLDTLHCKTEGGNSVNLSDVLVRFSFTMLDDGDPLKTGNKLAKDWLNSARQDDVVVAEQDGKYTVTEAWGPLSATSLAGSTIDCSGKISVSGKAAA